MYFRSIIALALTATTAVAKVSFNNDIRPLLSNTCFRCHGPDEGTRKAKLRLDNREGALADHDGVRAIVPGDIDASEVIYRLTAEDPDELMPPPTEGERFTPDQVALLKQWIAEGAEYETHWAYAKPMRPRVPGGAGQSPIDALLLQRLSKEKLSFAPEADRHVLARRVALDLTGLPPTKEEVAAFVGDASGDAYGKLVDRLLAKPAFGEHWARMWLDLARYADSSGYADDPPRTIWGYRDWVIRAFNNNMPFDQFTIHQVSGDLLENATDDQIIATGFHRNTQTNNEGGTQDEEFRNVAIVDRVNTTMATWMGTTMACAQCHTHKYDPITQEEYFKMFAILNQTQDADRRDESPTLAVFTTEQKQRKSDLQGEIADLQQSLSAPNEENLAALSEWEAGLIPAENGWMPVGPMKAEATSGATFTHLEDNSYLVSGKSAETDTYTIEGLTHSKGVSAVKLELLPHESLSDWHGPGRLGNFVLNELELSAGLSQPAQAARFVRIDLPGKGKMIHLAEVQVFDTEGNNIALKGKASQSSDYANAVAARAIDGNTDGDYNKGSVTHTAIDQNDPHWEVDLGSQQQLTRVVVWNRTDGDTRKRLNGFKISALDSERKEVWSKTIKEASERELAISLEGGQTASFANASSTFDQKDFDVAKAIDGDAGGHSGWAVGPEMGKAHHAIFNLDRMLPGGVLRFTLKQTYADHAIGRFRLSVSNGGASQHALPHAIAETLQTPKADRSEEQVAALLDHFADINPVARETRQRIESLEKELGGIKAHTTVPVMRELAEDKRRKTHIQLRGSYLNKADEVTPGLPAAFHPLPEGFSNDRLGLAQWLVDERNPLTARVMANRFWEKIFGIGIVPTSEEFGSQGERPTHPELLDWLAVEFEESGWDMKAFLKLLVTSRAYRQDTKLDEALAERDPDNRLLARGPRFRLSAEMVRDQALAVAGLLSPKMFGNPVRPPQPNLGIKAAFGGGIDWKTSDGEDKYRRGLYTNWRRSNPYPSMAAFDAPNREVCTVRRDRTNTPLQALVTLNDPVYIEAAQALARRMHAAAKEGKSTAAGIEHGFQLCLSRPAKAAESQRLVALFNESFAHYKTDTKMAKKMATEPIGAAPDGVDLAELAALTLVGNVLLNLDEILMKR